MKLTRRSALVTLAGAAALRGRQTPTGDQPKLDLTPGPFQGTRESLSSYRVPDWFRDAKFGLWAHWGPQSGIEDGDWYARNMYIQGNPQYQYHVEHFGHPSKVGYKDLIPMWKAADFDADHLVSLYKKAGAKYFVSMAVHHDNFDLWNSKYQRWNAVNMGPKKDIVGMFRKATLENGLKFGVTEHLWITYNWFSSSHGHDETGPMKDVPYDGADPKFADLYATCPTVYNKKVPWNDNDIPAAWKQHWHDRIKDLIDNYQPDLLYTDGPLPFEDYGLNIVANLFNQSAARNGGQVTAVYNSKRREDCANGTCVLDVERGVVDGVWPTAWQTDTSVGDWHYRHDDKYKTPKQVIDLLVDIVSRNGNLLLNFPLPNSGKLDDTEMRVLDGITQWMNVNSEGIYATRPWKTFGEGPSLKIVQSAQGAMFNERHRKDLTAEDIRFTSKGNIVYAFVMGAPTGKMTIASLAGNADNASGRVDNVELLGGGKLKWTRDASGLQVEIPETLPSKDVNCLKIAT